MLQPRMTVGAQAPCPMGLDASTAVRIKPLDLDPDGLRDWFTAQGEAPYRATQILKWICQRGILDPHGMSNLSKPLRERLAAAFDLRLPVLESLGQTRDGTRKWLVRLGESDAVECVFIPEDDRGTLCISSQVGCPLDCRFCATGKQGFSRNLSCAEIIAQVWLICRELGQFSSQRRIVSNVVFMGMGEPLLNADNVLKATRLLTHSSGFGLARRKVTISTAGVVDGIDRLTRESDVALALSLHAAENALRDQLVPLNRRWNVAAVLAACRRWAEARKNRAVTIEYIMIDGINDAPQQAHALISALDGLSAKINLIPYNPIAQADWRRSSPEAINRFHGILVSAGLIAITRKTRGDDINAACGQLTGRLIPKAARRRTALLHQTDAAT